MSGKTPVNIPLYRIVHWQNVEHILHHGLCCVGHPEANPTFINIGHQQLITDRHTHPITQLPDAGNLGEYVPFYFGPFSPMLLMIKNGTPPVQKRPQEDIVYIISSVKTIKDAGLEYCFTDRQAKRKLAGFYRDDEKFEKIDWEVVGLQQWHNTRDYQDRMERKQAEFLIRHHVPVSCINWLGVRNEERKRYFEEMIARLGLTIQVFLDAKNQLYYP
ncbi:MAG: DUF4433 domain-containing protein [Cytophagales bacterium]|nr:MAG: DUF4433 domain-containing protein [Cytophagales bacterium]